MTRPELTMNEQPERTREADGDAVFAAIKRDDVDAFDARMSSVAAGELCFGRFPTLSLIYLYGAKKIAKKYESDFLRLSAQKFLDEPIDATIRFGTIARKCLRLYFAERVTPAEMLLILGKERRIEKLAPRMSLSPGAKARMEKIYAMRYGLGVRFEPDSVRFDRRPRTQSERRRLLVSALSAVLCVALIVSTPFAINAFKPLVGAGGKSAGVSGEAEPGSDAPGESEPGSDAPGAPGHSDNPEPGSTTVVEEKAAGFENILFGSNKTYEIQPGSAPPSSDKPLAEESKCGLTGAESTMLRLKNRTAPLIRKNAGKISNLSIEIEYDGSVEPVPLIDQNCGDISDLKITATFNDAKITKNFASLAKDNSANIANVELTLKGTVLLDAETQNMDSMAFCGLVVTHSPVTVSNPPYTQTVSKAIRNCKIDAQSLKLVGTPKANGACAGVAALCESKIFDCATEGRIETDTVDAAGITLRNRGTILGCENKSSMADRTSDALWSPIHCGIVAINEGIVSQCKNSGDITSEFSVAPSASAPSPASSPDSGKSCAYVAGIAKENVGSAFDSPFWTPFSSCGITDCANEGKLVANATDAHAMVAGICAENKSLVENSTNSGEIISTAKNAAFALASGICCQNSNKLSKIRNSGKIKASSDANESIAGGICSSSSGSIDHSSNAETVDSESVDSIAYSAGVCGHSVGQISYATNAGDISSKSTNGESMVAGICALGDMLSVVHSSGEIRGGGKTAYIGGLVANTTEPRLASSFWETAPKVATLENGIFDGALTALDGTGDLHMGGIAGFAREKGFKMTDGTTQFRGAEIRFAYFLGEMRDSNAKGARHVGALAGVVGKNAYESCKADGSAQAKSFADNCLALKPGQKEIGAVYETKRESTEREPETTCVAIAENESIASKKCSDRAIKKDARYCEIMDALGLEHEKIVADPGEQEI